MFGSIRRAVRKVARVARKATPKPAPITVKKPPALAKLQRGLSRGIFGLKKAAHGGVRQLKTNIHSATTKTRSNVHGVTTAGRTGLHEGTSAAKVGVNTAYSGVKALGKKIADPLGQVTTALTQAVDKAAGGQTGASQKAMGSGTEVADTGGKYGSKALLGKSKRKKGDTKKDKLKVRVGGEQYA